MADKKIIENPQLLKGLKELNALLKIKHDSSIKNEHFNKLYFDRETGCFLSTNNAMGLILELRDDTDVLCDLFPFNLSEVTITKSNVIVTECEWTKTFPDLYAKEEELGEIESLKLLKVLNQEKNKEGEITGLWMYENNIAVDPRYLLALPRYSYKIHENDNNMLILDGSINIGDLRIILAKLDISCKS